MKISLISRRGDFTRLLSLGGENQTLLKSSIHLIVMKEGFNALQDAFIKMLKRWIEHQKHIA